MLGLAAADEQLNDQADKTVDEGEEHGPPSSQIPAHAVAVSCQSDSLLARSATDICDGARYSRQVLSELARNEFGSHCSSEGCVVGKESVGELGIWIAQF